MKYYCSFIFICMVTFLASCATNKSEDWTDLLDMDLSQWRIWQSYQLSNGYRGQAPTDADGNALPFIGYDKNLYGMVTMEEDNGEPVIHMRGVTYGCVISNQSFRNYHLRLQVKFGTQKWEPRLDKAEDSGLLYHSIGEPGVDYWKAWMRSYEFQMMESGTDEGNTGDYWSIAGTRADIRIAPNTNEMPTERTIEATRPFYLYDPQGEWTTVSRAFAPDYNSPKDQWTQIDLICYENQSLHIVNGKVAMALKNLRYVQEGQEIPLTEGKIQLQSESGEVYYKGIQIKEITEMPAEYLPYFE